MRKSLGLHQIELPILDSDREFSLVKQAKNGNIPNITQRSTPSKITLTERLHTYKFKSSQAKLEPTTPEVLGNARDMKWKTGSVVMFGSDYSKASRRNAINRLNVNVLYSAEISEIIRKQPLLPIDPDSIFKRTWETVKLLVLLYQCYYLPASISFLEGADYISLYVIDKLMDIFFLIDICLNFITMVYYKYDLEKKYRNIARLYLQSWLFLDLIAIVPIDEIMRIATTNDKSLISQSVTNSGKLFRLLRLIRLFKFFKFFQTFNVNEASNYLTLFLDRKMRDSLILTLLRNLLMLVTLLHCVSCFWYLLSALMGEDGWIIANGYEQESNVDLYVYSCYFVVQTFSSTGYGDVVSMHNYELAFKMVTIISGALIYGIFTGQIIELRAQSMEQEQLMQLRLQSLEEIRRNVGMSDFAYRMIQEKLHQQKKKFNKKHNLDLLSKEDRAELFYFKFISKFRHLKLFSKLSIHQDFVLKLGLAMKKRIFPKDDIIYYKDQYPSSFFIINKGSVGFALSDITTIPFCKIKNGFFGEFEIIKNTSRKFTAIALEDTELYYLGIEEFKKIMLVKDSELAKDLESYTESRQALFQKWHDTLCTDFKRKAFWRLAIKGCNKAIIIKMLKKMFEGVTRVKIQLMPLQSHLSSSKRLIRKKSFLKKQLITSETLKKQGLRQVAFTESRVYGNLIKSK